MVVGVCELVETGNTSTRLAPRAVTTALPGPRFTATPVGMGSVVKAVATSSLRTSTIETLLLPEAATTAKPACGYTATPWGLFPTASWGLAPKPVPTGKPVLGDRLTMTTPPAPTGLHPGSVTTATLWVASMATP